MTDEQKTILTYDSQQILDLIPHRYPFLLVDRITECVAGEYAEGYKNLTWNEPFFQGHFPNNPIMPGVLQIEAMAQCSAPVLLSMEKFQGKFLDAYDEQHPWCVLDPRYPEVREYLTDIYEKAVKEWDIDGLKLDFINNMQLTEASSAPDNNMDYVSLEDAICALLAEIKERLTALKSDILIEFRQPYTGPVMRRYGNMLRVADCPQDAVKNRAGVVDLRLLAHKTAVHSDMLMWNYDDTPESAALQLINAIFSVPQVSVLIEKLCEEQRKMLEFYLRFWKENKHCLIDGKLSAENPESCYSLITSEIENKIIAASYIKNVMNIKKAYNEIIFINGSWDDELFINNKYDDMKSECTIYNCTGEIKESKEIILKKGVNVFNIPKSGLVKLSISG